MLDIPIEVHKVVVAGDDYLAADGRALEWFCREFPTLANAEVEMVIGYDSNNIYAVTVNSWKKTQSGTATTTAVLEPTHTQTAVLLEGCYDYILRATMTDKSKITLAFGKLTVQGEPGLAPLQPA